MAYFMFLLLRLCNKSQEPKNENQYSWNSEVKTTWISLIGWPQKTSNMYIVCTYFVDSWNRKNCLKDDTVVFLLQTLQRISIILTTSVWVKLPTLTDILPLQLPYLKNRLWSSRLGLPKINDWIWKKND